MAPTPSWKRPAAVLERLGQRPLLDLGMRLGEGTGALLAVPLIQATARILTDTATLEEALAAAPAGECGR